MDPFSLTADDWQAFTTHTNRAPNFSAMAIGSSIASVSLASKSNKSSKAARRRGVRMETISRADAQDVCHEARRVSSSSSRTPKDDSLQTPSNAPRPDSGKLYRCAVPECDTKGGYLGPESIHWHMKTCHFPFAEGFPSPIGERKSKGAGSSHRADKRRSDLRRSPKDHPLWSDHYSMVERRIVRTAIRHRTFKALEETKSGRRVAVQVSMASSIRSRVRPAILDPTKSSMNGEVKVVSSLTCFKSILRWSIGKVQAADKVKD